ncbi:PREDICTED: uncharacterized protein LOC104821457 [Tarenaya hassleriana]|uniref:uncharacterized protein LOC104821457 n=1 Tax=Tarenaya hassleriana TaxID=28532 RepID=UPI00053C7784|nr:PREDICTED: uncharacterized protein LOC104821457 [Tarenaya hassleriana]
MDNNFENYHHQWRPGPVPPNICPVCTGPHFPFCPPYPPPSVPQDHNFRPYPNCPRPAFDSFAGPPHSYHPLGDPRPWQVSHGDHWRAAPDYHTVGDACRESDRRCKRSRVDEIGGGSPGLGVCANENYHSPNSGSGRIYLENERRLKMIRDHGCGFGGDGLSKPVPPPPGIPEINSINNSPLAGSGDRRRFSAEEMNRYGFRNEGHYNGLAPPPPAVTYGGYFGRPNGQPPIPVAPPPPPTHPSYHPSLFSVTGNSSAVIDTLPYPQVPNALPSSAQPAMAVRSNKPKVVDISQLLMSPHRASRPDHFVIILRGLPGSGKSYLAKMLRDIEVENGGAAPRIHSMDDYFMTEVEKVENNDSTSSSSGRSKKPVVKKVMEYCYEPEMEEAYRSSMLKAFKRTLEEGVFTFVIVDDRNLRVADFAQYWATAKRSGYEAYILEAAYKDPAGCAARNVHGFTSDQIQEMAAQWEEAPSLYMQLDIKSISRWDDLKENGIQEVDMDMEDDFGPQERKPDNRAGKTGEDVTEVPGSSKSENRWDAEPGMCAEEVKELSRSKWSNLDEDETEKSHGVKGNSNSRSGSSQRHCRKGESVRWGDQGGDTGFSIGAARNANMPSLVIGPGAGYNLKSNPLTEEESRAVANSINRAKMRSVFQDQLRAERESFKAVFDRKRRPGMIQTEE